MSILGVIIVLLIIGVLLPALGVTMDPTIRKIIMALLLLVVVLWLLSLGGYFPAWRI